VDTNPLTVDSPADACRGGMWFAVLPDCDTAPAAAIRLPGAVQVRRHASGRPWLVGRWPAGELMIGAAGDTQIGVFGAGCTTAAELESAAADVSDLRQLDRLAARLPGSFHLVASVAGAVRVQGSISGMRRVFVARVGDVDVAADRCDVLARATGAGVSPERLAICLLAPEAPYPLEGEVVWAGVESLAEDHFLALGRDGRHSAVRWWTPPEPALTLAEGASALRDTLTAAVGARARSGLQLSSDLSGGLDSTPVCFLAAAALRERGDRLISVTTSTGDPADDDWAWADIAARAMPDIDRVLLPAEDLPLPYADLLQPGPADDEPLLDPGARWHVKRVVEILTSRGAELHLTGDGGDEILEPEPSYLRDLLWSRPWRTLSHLRGYRALNRWSWPAALRLLTERTSYADWLAASANALTAPPVDDDAPQSAGVAYRIPPWAADGVADVVRERVLAAAAEVRLVDINQRQHEDLQSVRTAGHEVRQTNHMTARLGLPISAPFLDDRVIETCMAVRPDERADPRRYKPLMVEAMRGLLPDEWLRRGTKADGTSMHHSGLRAHRAKLVELCEDSELARLGLVDADRLRDQCTAMWTSPLWPVALSRTMGLERWLRDVRDAGHEALTATKG
jgi:asparagine synthase (glutamine-hydrolysing)